MKLLGLSRSVVIALALASCGGAPESARPAEAPKTAPAKPATARENPASAPSERAPALDGPPKIRLLDPGKQPRERLRYAPVAQQREKLLVRMNTNVAMGKPDLPGEPVELPSTSMHMNVIVDSVQPNGDVSYRFDVLAVDVDAERQPAELVAQIDAATQKLVGTVGHATLTNRGIVKRLSVSLPNDANPATRELVAEIDRSMHQICDPLPEEAVGVGARWDVHTRHSLRGMQIDQVRRYTLLEHNATNARMRFIVEQTAKPQRIALPNAPPGAVVRLAQLASAGEGTVSLDLSKLVPRESKLNLKTTSIVDVDADGRKATMRSDMQAEVVVSPEDGAKK